MKQRQPRKARNMAAKALRECKLFAPKVLPAKKGKGVIYSRKSRNAVEPSGSYYFWLTKIVKWAMVDSEFIQWSARHTLEAAKLVLARESARWTS